MNTDCIITKLYESPCGRLLLGSYENKLCICDWQTGIVHNEKRLKQELGVELKAGSSLVIDEATQQLDEYFAAKRMNFSIPLILVGTIFQKKVWQELLNTPYGQTITYGRIAQNIGLPSSVRAAANAIGKNPISIFVPCHRVIGSGGSLTGYAGGLDSKKYLLELEDMSNGLFNT